MENRENTFNEMQQQLRILKEKLESQTIINERLLRNAYSNKLDRLKKRVYFEIGLSVFAMLTSVVFLSIASMSFFIATEIMLAICIIATLIIFGNLPSMNSDLISAATRISKFRKRYVVWFYIGLPIVLCWLGWLLYELYYGQTIGREEFRSFAVSILIGGFIGFVLGFTLRNKMIKQADDVLRQIEELKNMN